MWLFVVLYNFMAGLFWGCLIGSHFNQRHPSALINLSKIDLIWGAFPITIIALAISIITPADEIQASFIKEAILVGLLVGFFAGRSLFRIK
jgi:hypothetical protein